jgi:hypothetical protein
VHPRGNSGTRASELAPQPIDMAKLGLAEYAAEIAVICAL